MSVKYVNSEEDRPDIEPGPESSAEGDTGLVRAEYTFPFFTIILIVSLVAVYLAQTSVGLDASFPFADANNRLIHNGQYWRLVTGGTMHGFNLHLVLNCMALYSLGSAIEFLSNRVHLAIVFFFAVIGGSLMSAAFSPDIHSVGASGGILGLAGYLTVYGFKRRRLLPPGFLRTMLINIAFVVAMGIIGYQYIDNAAHFGGLVVGAFYGLIQVPGSLYEDPRKADIVTVLLGYATLLAFIGFAVLTILLILRKISL